MPRHARFALRAILLLALALVPATGCDFFDQYVAKSPQDALAAVALDLWAAPGKPFLEGVSGRDTVASVSPTGAHAWEVAVVPPTGGAPKVWALEIPRIEVYPVFAGPDFMPWLEAKARELGLHTFIPPDLTAEVRGGQILSVGDLEVSYGLADGAGRNTEEHIAYLVPFSSVEDAVWKLQPTSRSAAVLMQALQLVVDDLVRRDDRVMTCMRSASPIGVPRDKQLDCVHDVLKQQFGGA